MAAVGERKPSAGRPQAWPVSAEAYHVLGELGLIPERTELLYGEIFPKMSKSPFHRFLVQRLLRLLRHTDLPGCFVWQEQPIACGDSEPEPDLAVLRGQEDAYVGEHPTTADLVIEVCVTSREYDRSKLRAYAKAGVKEVWFVLGPEAQIEVHRRPTGDEYADRSLHGPGGEVTSRAVPNLRVELTALFAK